MSFFNERLSLEFSYYKKDVKDLIILANLAPTIGLCKPVYQCGHHDQ